MCINIIVYVKIEINFLKIEMNERNKIHFKLKLDDIKMFYNKISKEIKTFDNNNELDDYYEFDINNNINQNFNQINRHSIFLKEISDLIKEALSSNFQNLNNLDFKIYQLLTNLNKEIQEGSNYINNNINVSVEKLKLWEKIFIIKTERLNALKNERDRIIKEIQLNQNKILNFVKNLKNENEILCNNYIDLDYEYDINIIDKNYEFYTQVNENKQDYKIDDYPYNNNIYNNNIELYAYNRSKTVKNNDIINEQTKIKNDLEINKVFNNQLIIEEKNILSRFNNIIGGNNINPNLEDEQEYPFNINSLDFKYCNDDFSNEENLNFININEIPVIEKNESNNNDEIYKIENNNKSNKNEKENTILTDSQINWSLNLCEEKNKGLKRSEELRNKQFNIKNPIRGKLSKTFLKIINK